MDTTRTNRVVAVLETATEVLKIYEDLIVTLATKIDLDVLSEQDRANVLEALDAVSNQKAGSDITRVAVDALSGKMDVFTAMGLLS